MDTSTEIDSKNLLLRAIDMNKDVTPKVTRYNKEYNFRAIEEYLSSHSDEITREVGEKILSGNIGGAVHNPKDHIIAAHVQPQYKTRKEKEKVDKIMFLNADKLFQEYTQLLKNPNSTDQELRVGAERYQKEKKKVSMESIEADINDWKNKTDHQMIETQKDYGKKLTGKEN